MKPYAERIIMKLPTPVLASVVVVLSLGMFGCSSNSSALSEQTGSTAQVQDLSSFEAVEEAVVNDVDLTTDALISEYEQLASEITTYEGFLDNTERIDSFYEDVVKETSKLCIVLEGRCATYAEIALSSGDSKGAIYDDLEGMYDAIYEDAFEDIYDDIYEGVLKEMYDTFYDGILKDAYDSASYGQWSDARSDEYSRWSDARSDVYRAWSDARSDIYRFWSSLRSDVYGNKIERAQKELEDFQEDIEKAMTSED